MTSSNDPGVIRETERGIASARGILALIGSALVLGTRVGQDGNAISIPTVAIALSFGAGAAALWKLPQLLVRCGLGATPRAMILQILDILAALGFVYGVRDGLSDASWALLAIPIVFASLRLSAAGVLWVWSLTSAGYIGLLWADLLEPGKDALSTSLVLERPGALLAIAAGIALLTRWLQAGWVEQESLTTEAHLRFQHIRAIERAGREMRGRTPDEVVDTCLHHVVALGFDAATASGVDVPLRAVGDGSIVPADETVECSGVDVVSLTEWHGPNGCVYSAAKLEPVSGLVISGWTHHPPGSLQADAMSELVAHTTSGIELARLFGQARYEADHDALTGLANRSAFERLLAPLAQAPEAVAMLYMDLDHFKKINDRYGHDAGDWALQQVAAILSENVNHLGLAARFGGDEFVAVLNGLSTDEIQQLADRMLADVREVHDRVTPRGLQIELGISIGIAIAPGTVDADELRRTADTALFEAKARGRGQSAITWVAPGTAPDAGFGQPIDQPMLLPPPLVGSAFAAPLLPPLHEGAGALVSTSK